MINAMNPNRRQVCIGLISFTGASVLGFRAEAALLPWVSHFSAGAAANLLVETMKNYGWIPERQSHANLRPSHSAAEGSFERQGYAVKRVYIGDYSVGRAEVSQASRGTDVQSVCTTDHHGGQVCSIVKDKADVIMQGVTTSILRHKGLSPRQIEAVAFPLHPPAANHISGNRRMTPSFMTPSHGTVRWTSDMTRTPNFSVQIRSQIVGCDIVANYAGDNSWAYDYQPV